MKTLPSGFLLEKDKLHQEGVWHWLWQVEANRTVAGCSVFQFVAHDQPVTYGGLTYYPWAIEQSEMEQDGEGNLPTLALSLDNCTGLLSYYFYVGQGFQGNRATALLVNSLHLTGPTAGHLQVDFTINEGSLDTSTEGCVVTLKLESNGYEDRQSPQDRFNATRCRFIYGDELCGYVLNAVAGFQTCNKTMPNCIERGGDMALRGLPRLQPQSFGGFLGISVRR